MWVKFPPQQLEQSDGHYRPGDIVGKAGLERQYNDQLEGTDGMRRVVVNSVGKVMRTLDDVEAIPGKPIQLTIDYDLQAVAEADLADKEGAVVAMDARTGEVLAMVSRPDVRSQRFRRAHSRRRMGSSSIPIRQTPLLNRAIQAQLAPGSVFKIVMATAMLESKAIPANFTVYCPGYAEFYGRTFHCWRPAGHGVGRPSSRPSSLPATCSSTTSASCWASTAFTITPPGSASAGAPASICRAKNPG